MGSILSPTGQAVAAIVGDVLSLLAIVIAFSVALVEQRRFNAERERELRRDREAQVERRRETAAATAKSLRVAITLISLSEQSLFGELKRIELSGNSYVGWRPDDGIPHVMLPFLDSLRAMQNQQQQDADIVLILSHAIRALHELVNGVRDPAPTASFALKFASQRFEELKQRRSELEAKVKVIQAA